MLYISINESIKKIKPYPVQSLQKQINNQLFIIS